MSWTDYLLCTIICGLRIWDWCPFKRLDQSNCQLEFPLFSINCGGLAVMQLSGYALATTSIGTVDASRMFESLFQRYIFTCGLFVAHLPNVYPERLKSDTSQTFRCWRFKRKHIKNANTVQWKHKSTFSNLELPAWPNKSQTYKKGIYWTETKSRSPSCLDRCGLWPYDGDNGSKTSTRLCLDDNSHWHT